jgi:hypothetical protein
MAYLVEFWLILESGVVQSAHKEYLLNRYETVTQHNTDFNLAKTFFLTKFGFVMNKL